MLIYPAPGRNSHQESESTKGAKRLGNIFLRKRLKKIHEAKPKNCAISLGRCVWHRSLHLSVETGQDTFFLKMFVLRRSTSWKIINHRKNSKKIKNLGIILRILKQKKNTKKIFLRHLSWDVTFRRLSRSQIDYENCVPIIDLRRFKTSRPPTFFALS